MTQDPQRVQQLLSYVTKAVWLIMAYAFGSMVGQLILYARHSASP